MQVKIIDYIYKNRNFKQKNEENYFTVVKRKSAKRLNG